MNNDLTPYNPATDTLALMQDGAKWDRLCAMAKLMASGFSTIPAHLRGNEGDCMAIILQSLQWQISPFAVAQKTYVVGNGGLAYEAQLIAAVINRSGVVIDRFHYEWTGPWERIIGKFEIKKNPQGQEYRVPGWKLADEEGLSVTVYATLRGETQPRVLHLLLAQARTRNSGLWADDPKQQLAYLAQKKWARLYAPDVILGVYSKDELEDNPSPLDMGPVVEVPQAPPISQIEIDARAAAQEGKAAFRAWWLAQPKQDRNNLSDLVPELQRLADAADASRTVDTPPATEPAACEP